MKYNIFETNLPGFIVSSADFGISYDIPRSVITQYLQKQAEYEKAWRQMNLWISISDLEKEREHLQNRIDLKKRGLDV